MKTKNNFQNIQKVHEIKVKLIIKKVGNRENKGSRWDGKVKSQRTKSQERKIEKKEKKKKRKNR